MIGVVYTSYMNSILLVQRLCWYLIVVVSVVVAASCLRNKPVSSRGRERLHHHPASNLNLYIRPIIHSQHDAITCTFCRALRVCNWLSFLFLFILKVLVLHSGSLLSCSCWIFSPHQFVHLFFFFFFFSLFLFCGTKRRLTCHRVNQLRPQDTEDDPYFYTFKVQCTSCREVHPNWISFTRFVRLHLPPTSPLILGAEKDTDKLVQEQHEIPGSRGEANFVWRCKLCQVPPLLSLKNTLGGKRADNPENTLCYRDNRPERLRSRREAQRSKDYRSRLSGIGIYRV